MGEYREFGPFVEGEDYDDFDDDQDAGVEDPRMAGGQGAGGGLMDDDDEDEFENTEEVWISL
jgi:hypothetical protein